MLRGPHRGCRGTLKGLDVPNYCADIALEDGCVLSCVTTCVRQHAFVHVRAFVREHACVREHARVFVPTLARSSPRAPFQAVASSSGV